VPLKDRSRIAHAVLVTDHRKRHRRHREHHHAVTDRGATERNQEYRLAHDNGERSDTNDRMK